MLCRAQGRWRRTSSNGSGCGPVTGLLGEYEDFLTRRADWPGMPLLREKGEVAVARSTTPGRVINYFTGHRPETGTGVLAQVQALGGRGANEQRPRLQQSGHGGICRCRRKNRRRFWRFTRRLWPALHEARLDRLLWEDKPAEARRMLPLVSPGWQALATARMGLRAQVDGVNALIAAVPPGLAGDPGLAYERYVWRIRARSGC